MVLEDWERKRVEGEAVLARLWQEEDRWPRFRSML